MINMRDQLAGELLTIMATHTASEDIKNRLYLALSKYEISERETSVAIRNEDKNQIFLQKFLIAKTVQGCTERTIRVYSGVIRRSLDSMEKNADELTTEDVRIYLALRQKRDGISKSFVNTELRYLNSFFSFLEDEGFIDQNPAKRIEKIKYGKKQRPAFSEIEIELIRNACRTNRERCIIEMLLSTGCRVTELTGMKITDIGNEKILVHGKGEKDRMVYLNAKVQIALKNYLDERKDRNPYIFAGGINFAVNPSKRGKREMWYTDPKGISQDRPIDKGTIEQIVRKLGKRAGVENVHPHRFRRTCATLALRHGMPLMIVSKMLGHENVATTQIYLDLDEKELQEAHRRYVV